MDLQNCAPFGCFRQGHMDMHAEPTWPEDRWIDEVDAVRSADDDDMSELLDAIKLRQQLIDHALGCHGALMNTAHGRDRIELIEENECRCDLACDAEY